MQHELPAGFVKDLIGYCDPLSVLPGQRVAFKLSAWGEAIGAQPDAAIVRLSSGDTRPHGTGLIETHIAQVDCPALRHQPLITGSYAQIPSMADFAADRVHSLSVQFYPTLLRDARQTLLNWGALNIAVSEQGIYVRGSEDELVLPASLQLKRWYTLTVDLRGSCSIELHAQPLGVAESSRQRRIEGASIGEFGGAELLLACQQPGEQHFNGRLEAPVLYAEDGKPLLAWDFSQGIDSQQIHASDKAYDGMLLQHPTRAVKGSRWDGSIQGFAQDPSQYAAIHFHEDDLTDAGWQDTVHWQVPDALSSGVYALKVSAGDSEDYMPFFVKAAPGKRQALAYLVPTASYLAYANQRVGFEGGPLGGGRLREANSAFLYAHEDVGYSMYEYHRDRSGVHFSSRLRPIVNMKPKNTTWAFNADTHITAWLDAIEQPFDVITDEDLHLQGQAALDGYRVVITGTHPEYYSTEMRAGLEQWLGDGGRLMYMGGNGFYWRVAFQPDNPAVMEVRRAEDGTRAWIAEPGEYYQQFDGAYGGLWRRQDKPPNQLVGIGFAAQGFDGGTYYRLQPGALDPRVAFALQGIEQTDVIGDYGNQGGGAAGEEIDRWDAELGSPAHAVIIATSENHRPGMLRVKEEFHMMEMPGDDPKVRADMVFFEVPGGGAVFSTGSISYAGALAHQQYDNDIARLTVNVLRRFLDAEPFNLPTTGAE